MKNQADVRIKRHNRKGKMTTFEIGEYVLVRTHERSKALSGELKKFFDIYIGPFMIKEIPHPNAYRLVYPKSGKLFGLRNVTELKLYK